MRGKVAVVTGAAAGIGRAIAERLSAEGAYTLLADVDADEAERVADDLRRSGRLAEAHRCDVSDPDDVERVMEAAEAAGGPHALVSNAGIADAGTAEETTPDVWDHVLAVDLKGVYLCARAAIPRMQRLGGGSIVNMSSANGTDRPRRALFCYYRAREAVRVRRSPDPEPGDGWVLGDPGEPDPHWRLNA